MSFRWPNKDPDETLDYSVDWSRYLGSAQISTVTWFAQSKSYNTKTQIDAGETLATASGIATTDTIQNVSQTNTTQVATINIAGGTHNEEYTFTCRIADSTGSTSERTIKLKVKER
jgi:DNA-binding transcriptional regulator LsrR (DeoR family)